VTAAAVVGKSPSPSLRQRRRRQQAQAQAHVVNLQVLDPPRKEENSTASTAGVSTVASTIGNDTFFFPIVGGAPVQTVIPYFGFWERGCGAALVAPDILVTAAHCGNPLTDLASLLVTHPTVTMGSLTFAEGESSSSSTHHTISHAIPHPRYDATGEQYDVMLLKVNQHVLASSPAAAMIPLNKNPGLPQAGQSLLVMGMGVTDAEADVPALATTLQEVDVNVMDQASCEEAYTPEYDHATMLCAGQVGGGKDACQGRFHL